MSIFLKTFPFWTGKRTKSILPENSGDFVLSIINPCISLFIKIIKTARFFGNDSFNKWTFSRHRPLQKNTFFFELPQKKQRYIIICTWSTHTFPSISCTCFISHNFFMISTKSFFVSPYIIFLRNFGIKTIWYVQFHRVCVILWLSILDISYAFDMACETNIIIA